VATFYVANFGCRATQADGAAIERQLRERGLERAEEPTQAGLVVLNTCTVTAAADQDARAAIRRIHRKNPDAQIVVTGCYAQRAPEEIAALPGVTKVIGNSHKHLLAQLAWGGLRTDAGPQTSDLGLQTSDVRPRTLDLDSQIDSKSFVPITQLTSDVRSPIFVSDIFAHTELQAAPVFDAANERTRPNLKVQDGCDNRCSFCVIPHVRGNSRSLPLAGVIREVETLVMAGYREVVISGINLGRWGRDLAVSSQLSAVSAQVSAFRKTGQRPTTKGQRPLFEDLVRTILSETALEKLRISSVEPMDWSDELIRMMAESPRIAKHAHVPLQSGSDAVLRRMHRKYRPWHYREKIEKIHAAMPTAAIGSDVMVGFPGESEAEFEETRRLVEDLPFTYLHVFTYSARPGTQAAAMGKQVPIHVARERNRVLRDLVDKKKLAFMNGFMNKPVEVITLGVRGSDHAGKYTEGLTDNYLPMRMRGDYAPNLWLRARVERVLDGALQGIAS
jgi:threonylcarbamoyladenosine tRNA methylthiotransferase MtaB